MKNYSSELGPTNTYSINSYVLLNFKQLNRFYHLELQGGIGLKSLEFLRGSEHVDNMSFIIHYD